MQKGKEENRKAGRRKEWEGTVGNKEGREIKAKEIRRKKAKEGRETRKQDMKEKEERKPMEREGPSQLEHRTKLLRDGYISDFICIV